MYFFCISKNHIQIISLFISLHIFFVALGNAAFRDFFSKYSILLLLNILLIVFSSIPFFNLSSCITKQAFFFSIELALFLDDYQLRIYKELIS